MSDKGLQVDNEPHELKLGSSFDPKSKVGFHTIRYDFKPASVDTTKDSLVEVGEAHQITVTVPHVEGAGTDHTVYKGNKRPCMKECVLIIDHKTGTFTLEKLTNNCQLKKTRMERLDKAPLIGRPLTPVEVNRQKNSPAKPKTLPTQVSPPSRTNSPSVTPVNLPQDESSKDACLIGEISDDSSYDSSSGSDSDQEDKAAKSSQQEKAASSNIGSLFKNIPSSSAKPANTRPQFASTLSEDLRLSESSSSDSDDD